MRKKMIQCFEWFSISMRAPHPRQTTNIDGRAIWKRCTHSDIAWGLVKAFSSQIVVWTKYVCTISGAHVLKIALRKLSPRSFRQDFFSHKLVIALDCTQKKKRFNFLFSSFPHQPPFNFSSTVSNCPNLVMYICRQTLKYENITWLKWSVFVGIHSIHSSCTYFLTNINILTNIIIATVINIVNNAQIVDLIYFLSMIYIVYFVLSSLWLSITIGRT